MIHPVPSPARLRPVTRIPYAPRASRVIHIASGKTAEGRAATRARLEAVRTLGAPNLVGVASAHEVGDSFLVVTRRVSGVPLADLVTRVRRLPVEVAVRIVRDVCDGLEALGHAEVICTNAITTANVLVGDNGVSRIDEVAIALTSLRPTVGRSAVYAVGALLWEVVTGTPCPPAAISQPAGAPVDRVLLLRRSSPETPAALAAIVARCVTPEPDVYPNLAAVARALAETPSLGCTPHGTLAHAIDLAMRLEEERARTRRI